MDSQQLADENVRWDIRVKKVDLVYKVLILIIGTAAAGAFLLLQNRQAEDRYYTDLMSQRERADTDLRAEMFKVLFEAYFKNKIQVDESDQISQPSLDDAANTQQRRLKTLASLRQEAMLSDLLARNFDNIDVRPLLEDLDERLTQQIAPRNDRALGFTQKDNKINQADNATPTPEQRQAFRQRQQLRRMAISATSRQVAALEGLTDQVQTSVTYHRLDTCESGSENKKLIDLIRPDLPDEVVDEGGHINIERVRDGAIDLRIVKFGKQEEILRQNDREDYIASDIALATTFNLSITFFDMPTLENIRLSNGNRVAYSLYKYYSKQDCARFKDDMDETLQEDCDSLQSPKQECHVAHFRTVILPKNFLVVRDRPYVNDLAAGRYRDPWWKFW
jgi:hypothetical protein